MPSNGQLDRKQPSISCTSSLASVVIEASISRRENRFHLKSASYARMYGLSDIYSAFLRQAVRNMALKNLQPPMMWPIISMGQTLETRISETISAAFTLRNATKRFCSINGNTSYRPNSAIQLLTLLSTNATASSHHSHWRHSWSISFALSLQMIR